jgi:puromycin-sensitive aminopeptidase
MSQHRLPQSVVPSRYEIELAPDLSAFVFQGKETVEVTVREPVQEIVLNATELQLHSVTIRNETGERLVGRITLDEEAERARLHFPETLAPGPWVLEIAFTGLLNDKLHGFYRSTYTLPPSEQAAAEAAGSTTGVLAATQFEATDARRAFPCWDEPACKAVFDVTLVVDEPLAAISNTRAVAERTIPGTGKKAVRFAPTIRMSTYLLAFVVGRLVATDPVEADGVSIRVWAVPGKGRLARFALEAAAFSLHFFHEYYDVPYPGDKLDLIAIPDFAFGAMENLGAITFRETALLADEGTATHAELTRIAHVVIHEIAHMWFGDLVTMAWWNGLWLNEAFATFMEVMAVDAWKPAWGRWEAFGASRAAAFLTDGLHTSRPVEFPVAAPKDAEAMFDVLTYEKGGAVLRMLEQYLGPEVFRDGVRRYLIRHQYANAETTDLWRALGEASRQAIPEVMEGWIFRPGYPLVTVSTADDGRTLCFSQRRFTYLPDGGEAGDIWRIPITYRARARGAVRDGRLMLASAEARVPCKEPVEWVVVNAGGHGFYRVQYAGDLWRRLVRNPGEILAPIERFNVLSDAWAVTLAGLLPVGEYLDATAAFGGETDRTVWSALLAPFTYLSRLIEPACRPGFEALVRDRLAAIVARLGWSPAVGEDERTRQLRGEILRVQGTLGNDPATQETARARYARQRAGSEAVDSNVAAALVAICAHAGSEADYESFVAAFKGAATPQEEQRYLKALADFRDPALVGRTLAFALSGEVRTQDAPFLMRETLMGVHSREQAWLFVKEHWEAMERLFPSLTGLRRMCEGVTGLATPELEADVRRFFAERKISLGGKTLEQYLEQLRIAVAFREREAAGLASYLSRRSGASCC